MRVCLITTGQPSTNPRLVKEADALVAAGHQVHVVAAHWADWATETDEALLATRTWSVSFVDWRKSHAPALFLRSRVRHWVARKALTFPSLAGLSAAAVTSRVGPELAAAAAHIPAELYIAHNLGALPAACAAARVHSAKLGFDAEDFHSGQLSSGGDARMLAFTREVERRFLPRCDYVTAAAPGIAEAYRDLCAIRLPVCVLNVFPLRDRPDEFRRSAPGDRLRLYWFSQTIGPNRGLEDAVRALGLLAQHPIELHLRGAWQAGYEDRLRRVAAEAGIESGRIVSHAPAHPDEMPRLASEFSVGLALEPGTTVNNDLALSNKIFAYVLGGNAVLATRTRGQSTLIPQLGPAAAWCTPADPNSLAAALRPWIDNRGALEAARQTAWNLGASRFNWELETGTFLRAVPIPSLRGNSSGAVRASA
jgi:glycosyltransferase involved in cell wall biosynthesis